MYNDLAAEQSQEVFAGVAHTVLVAEGEDRLKNAGHAWEPDGDPLPVLIGKDGLTVKGFGAALKDALTRHSDGANYLLADGHVKWFKQIRDCSGFSRNCEPDLHTVFFPPRASAFRSHLDEKKQPAGPDPGGNMTFQDHIYAATFHLD